VDPVAGAAKAAEALGPAGRLAVFWNALLFPPEVAEAFAAVYRRVLPDVPSFRREASGVEAYSAFFAKTIEGIREAGSFGEPERWQSNWERSYTATSGSTRCRPLADSTCLPGKAGGAAGRYRGRDRISGVGAFTMGYAAVVVTAPRAAAT
jgi:hypothetical protein